MHKREVETNISMAATGIVLAGGKGRRIGGGKTKLEFGGRSLLEHAVSLARGWFDDVIVVGGVEVDGAAGVRVVADFYAGQGPLGGIHSGLIHAKCEKCLVVGCDMPFVKRNLVEMLLSAGAEADVAIPRSDDGRLHPLIAVYGKSCVPAIGEQLKRGENKIIEFFGDVKVRYVDEAEWRKADPDGRSLFNINTREDYNRALEMFKER